MKTFLRNKIHPAIIVNATNLFLDGCLFFFVTGPSVCLFYWLTSMALMAQPLIVCPERSCGGAWGASALRNGLWVYSRSCTPMLRVMCESMTSTMSLGRLGCKVGVLVLSMSVKLSRVTQVIPLNTPNEHYPETCYWAYHSSPSSGHVQRAMSCIK